MGLLNLFKKETQKYEIGDDGPAGGNIFYINPNFKKDKWMYLESAPKKSEWKNKKWSDSKTIIGTTDSSIGAGFLNTLRICTYTNKKNTAVQLCRSLTYNGYKDWFLPSNDELNLLYINLKTNGKGGFSDEIYWASTEDQAFARVINFSDGRQGSSPKDSTFTVRAIRRL